MNTQLWQLSATDLAARIKTRELSAREAALDALARGEDPGILAGVPITTKDMSDQVIFGSR